MKHLFVLTITVMTICFSCSKKSNNDTPQPTNSNTNTQNNSTNTILYDTLNVTFKGQNYYKVGSVGLLGGGTDKYIVASPNFGTTSTKPQFNFGLALPRDSSKLTIVKIDTLKPIIAKGVNGLGLLLTYIRPYTYFFAGDVNRYFSGRIVSNRLEGERQQDKNNYSKVTYLKHKGVYVLTNPLATNQTYTQSIWLVKGNFSFVLYNENNFTDSTIVNGTFSIHTTAKPY
jgi:hypothetical protein